MADEWISVPKEPTREMWAASGDAINKFGHRLKCHHDCYSTAVWEAMLAAAPSSEEQPISPNVVSASALTPDNQLSSRERVLVEALKEIAEHPGPNADEAAWTRVEFARAALKSTTQEDGQ